MMPRTIQPVDMEGLLIATLSGQFSGRRPTAARWVWYCLSRAQGGLSSMVNPFNGLSFLHHRAIPPAPAPGHRIAGLVAAGHFRDSDAVGRAEFRRNLDLADGRLCQHAGGSAWNGRAGHDAIGKFLVLERQFRALDRLVRARAREALGEMTPVGRDQPAGVPGSTIRSASLVLLHASATSSSRSVSVSSPIT